MDDNNDRLRGLVAEVAAAYFSHSHVNSSEIPTVIAHIARSLKSVGEQATAEVEETAVTTVKATPAQIRKSLTEDGLVSFEDGRPYKTLRRHLTTRGLTPDQYRQKHGLPADYPMVAPSYSARRSELAKSLGLGQKGGRGAGVDTAARTAAKRGRKVAAS